MSLKNLKIVGLVGVLVVVMLSINSFFTSGSSTVFNEVLTPIATIVASIIYYRTFVEMRKSNEIALSSKSYDIFKSEIKLVLKKYRKTKYFTSSKFDKGFEKKYTVIEFEYLLENLVESVKQLDSFDQNVAFYVYDETKNPMQSRKSIQLIVSIITRVARNYSSLETIFREIIESKLDHYQKRNLIDKIKGDILVDYLSIMTARDCNKCFYKEQTLYYSHLELALVNPMNEAEVIPSFALMGFDNVYRLLNDNNYL